MKKYLGFITILAIVLSLMTSTVSYADTSELSIIEQNANTLVNLGIMKGYEDGSLRLNNKIKRSEFITLVVKMMAYDKDTNLANTKIGFKDLSNKHWAYTNIGLALKYELIAGYPDNTIAPDKDVTYAEEGGRVELQSDSGDYLEVLADSKDDGPVYCVCSIKNNDGKYALKNESRVLDLSGAFEQIPGFSLICND